MKNNSEKNEILKEILADTNNQELIEKAFSFAKKAHEGQKRASGEDYIYHPLRVAKTLKDLKLSATTLAAAILHDVPEDTNFSLQDIEENFGKEIAFLVEGVSKLGKLRYPKENLNVKPIESRLKEPIDLKAENLRKMFFAMAEDLRVILIKLADRLDNMRTLKWLPPEKQKRIALETLEIFAPLANRLGIGTIKGELEDLAFFYLYPKEYQWLKEKIQEKSEEEIERLQEAKETILKILAKENIKPLAIDFRKKHYWSLYQKLLRHEMNLEKIYDLVALRIIVKDVDSCYKTLGIIHQFFRPLPGRIKDYIANPKPSGYQSIHTTVFYDGLITEIQIKTLEMHQEAEYGIAAHWAMKEGIPPSLQRKKFAWVAQLREWQKNITKPEEFLEGLKLDFFKNRIFVFTPKGDVMDLPEGATPVDFAYAVHTEIGNHCVGAKVNGKLVSLSTSLKNGDIVEIITRPNKKPSRDWLDFVKTNFAKSKIKEWFKKESQKDNLQRGLEILNKDLQTLYNTTFNKISQAKKRELLKKFSYKTIEALLAKIGEGEISTQEVVRELFDEKETLRPSFETSSQIKKESSSQDYEVLLAGERGINSRLAKCCSPKPGQKIVAYITQNQIASIHQTTCPNLKEQQRKWPQKIIDAFWYNKKDSPTKVKIEVQVKDRLGLLRDIAAAITACEVNIVGHHSQVESPNKPTTIKIEVEIKSLAKLKELLEKIKEVEGVITVKRTG